MVESGGYRFVNEIVCGFQRYTFSQTGKIAESNKGWFADGVDLRNYYHSFVEDDANLLYRRECFTGN